MLKSISKLVQIIFRRVVLTCLYHGKMDSLGKSQKFQKRRGIQREKFEVEKNQWSVKIWTQKTPTDVSETVSVIITSEKAVGSNKNQKKKNLSELVIGGMYKCRDCDFLLQPADNSDIIITTETAAETSADVFVTFGEYIHFCNFHVTKMITGQKHENWVQITFERRRCCSVYVFCQTANPGHNYVHGKTEDLDRCTQ